MALLVLRTRARAPARWRHLSRTLSLSGNNGRGWYCAWECVRLDSCADEVAIPRTPLLPGSLHFPAHSAAGALQPHPAFLQPPLAHPGMMAPFMMPSMFPTVLPPLVPAPSPHSLIEQQVCTLATKASQASTHQRCVWMRILSWDL
eukprot:1157037-Pelagomonas_calceolata.AAC.8